MSVLYTRKQFAEFVGKSPQQIGVCIKRDGTVIEVNKKIDPSNPINKAFIAKVTIADVNKDIEKINNANDHQQQQKENSNNNHNQQAINNQSQQDQNNQLGVENIDFVLKQHTLKKLVIETSIKKLEYAKKKGSVIPIDFVYQILNTSLVGTVGKVRNEMNTFIEKEFEENTLNHKKTVHSIIEDAIMDNIETARNEISKEAAEYKLKTGW